MEVGENRGKTPRIESVHSEAGDATGAEVLTKLEQSLDPAAYNIWKYSKTAGAKTFE